MNFNSYFTIKHTSNLRILLLTLFFIVPLGTIYGQNQLITIAGKNITLLKAFDAIESQTQLSITYSRTKIDVLILRNKNSLLFWISCSRERGLPTR